MNNFYMFLLFVVFYLLITTSSFPFIFIFLYSNRIDLLLSYFKKKDITIIQDHSDIKKFSRLSIISSIIILSIMCLFFSSTDILFMIGFIIIYSIYKSYMTMKKFKNNG